MPAVLGWRTRSASRSVLGTLWQNVDELGWLPEGPVRVVVQVGHAYRSSIVDETVHTLAIFLAARLGSAVEVLNPAGDNDSLLDPAVISLPLDDVLELEGVAARGPLAVPRFWFSPHFLVTVTGAGPSPMARISAVFDAQAEVLRRLGSTEPAEVLIYEAHRLAASNLSVVCGHSETSGFWWAIGPSDVAVEQTVARAAGIESHTLPWLRALTQHEVVESIPQLLGSLPSLRDYAAPGWRTAIDGVGLRTSATVSDIGHDFRVFRQNAHKIPALVRRLIRGQTV